MSEVSRVSLVFQREDINVSSAITCLQSASAILNDMIKNPGVKLSEFPYGVVNGVFHNQNLHNVVNIDAFDRERRQILGRITECFEQRFRNLLEGPLFQC